MRRLWRRSRPLTVLVLAGMVVVVLAGAGAAVCRYATNCHLRHQSQLSVLANESKGAHAQLPKGFSETTVVAGLSFPTDFAFLPDGRALVAEKNGLVRIAADGRLLPQPFVDLRRQVNTQFYRGLIAVQVDPRFEENHYVYLLYVQRGTGPPTGPTTMRLIRVTAHGDTASLVGAKVLLGRAGPGSCSELPHGSDCLPSDKDHNGGAIVFAPDGTIFVSTGDGGGYDERIEPAALGAQDLDFLGGKLLHITRDGKGLPSNPFWNGDANANRSKVWAYGFRNPFRFTLRPGSGTPYVADVGSHTWEEVDVVRRGRNYGWPCYEGSGRSVVYRGTRLCKALYRRGPAAVAAPAYEYRHFGSESVTGGIFYTAADVPAAYRGAYVFGDWVRGWIRLLHFDAADKRRGGPKAFATNASGPVAFAIGPDRHLYYLALNAEQLRRIDYSP